MSRDGAGTYNLPPGNPVVTETVISSTTHNTTMADVATALTQSISKDGQTTYTANQSMGGFKHTQVADATARNQYATAAQVQDGNLTLIGSVSGTDTLTGTISPAVSAYANGVFLTLIPVNNNTGPVTLSLNGLGSKPVLKNNSVPLVAGDLLTGVPATLVYNGTNFFLENPQVPAADVARLSQANNFTSNNTFSVTGTPTAPTIRMSSSQPLLEMNNTSAPVDNRSWLNYVTTGGSWVLASDNEAHTSAATLITASKTSLALTATNITLNGVNASDYARLSQQTVFTGGSVIVSAGLPQLGLTETDMPANNRNWLWLVSGGQLVLNAYNDAYSDGFTCFRAIRSGFTVTDLQLTAATVSINGQNANTPALFTSGTLADARVAQSNVTQHQAALAITSSQVTTTVHTGAGASFSVSPVHAGMIIPCDSGSTITITVGPNCLGGNGKAVLLTRRNAAVVFSASGVTIRSPGGGTSITTQYGKAALIQMSSTEYELAGNV